ncbi:MAG: formate/nitrite transporter family protein [bacterium]|nr:formate/nitrite transporter family protein [bacterium]
MNETLEKIIKASQLKINMLNNSFLKYFILAMMAGIYVGFGVILIFSIGAPLEVAGLPIIKALMAASFGVALTVVVFAGSELFTGNNMIMTIGSLSKSVKWLDTLKLWIVCYLGNFLGSLLIAYFIYFSGLLSNHATFDFIEKVSIVKMTLPFWSLFFRGILCNMLVCLALWMNLRTTNDAAKILLIFWCLFAFIGSGFEHSIANMTIFGLSLFGPSTSSAVSWGGCFANLIPVTLGNVVGGALFIGVGYWYVGKK